jgi:RimJ/RimL family protein N-acetyltransferase
MDTKKIVETSRLVLRELTVGDAENMYLLNLDKDVIKYTGDVSFNRVDDAFEFLNNYDHYKKYGFGRWAVILKTDMAFLGWCGLKYSPDLNEHDIGFRLFKKYWNQGYATEAARACIDVGFNTFGIKTLIGRAMKENLGSITVLQKLGMTYFNERTCSGKPGVIYKIDKPNYSHADIR